MSPDPKLVVGKTILDLRNVTDMLNVLADYAALDPDRCAMSGPLALLAEYIRGVVNDLGTIPNT